MRRENSDMRVTMVLEVRSIKIQMSAEIKQKVSSYLQAEHGTRFGHCTHPMTRVVFPVAFVMS